LIGCGKGEQFPEETPRCTVYYLNSIGNQLVGSEYKTVETEREGLVQELLTKMTSVPAELDCQSAIPERIETITFRIEE
ncbi:hypothetical protein DK853_41455, partial [Klebsiella oxytoca]